MFTDIPQNPNELHRYLISRFLVSGILISVLIGGLVYYWESWRVESIAFDLAVVSAKHFDTPEMRELIVANRQSDHLEFAALLEKSGFVGIRIFDLSEKVLIESWRSDAINTPPSAGTHLHDFPKPGKTHSNWLNGEVIQVVIPLLDSNGAAEAYFEGVYRLDAEMQYTIKHQVRSAVLTAFVVVIVAMSLLYPVLLGLTKRSLSLSNSLLDSNLELLQALGSAIAKRDADTDLHNYRVTLYAVKLAEAMNMNRAQIESLIVGAFLHDVGKIGIPDQILLKPGRLTEEEFEIMKTHVTLGAEIIQDSHWLKQARDVVLFHHEKFDGNGYPHGIRSNNIPLDARLFAVVDVFDALMSKRPYKDSLPLQEALIILREGKGKHFDPEIIIVFETIMNEMYDEIGCADKSNLQTKMKAVTHQYF